MFETDNPILASIFDEAMPILEWADYCFIEIAPDGEGDFMTAVYAPGDDFNDTENIHRVACFDDIVKVINKYTEKE